MSGTNDETDPILLLASDPDPGGPGSALYEMKARAADDAELEENERLTAELDAAYERAAQVALKELQPRKTPGGMGFEGEDPDLDFRAPVARRIAREIRALKSVKP